MHNKYKPKYNVNYIQLQRIRMIQLFAHCCAQNAFSFVIFLNTVYNIIQFKDKDETKE